jgi:V/A-type H+/Na+-transporting ATPase subunit D
MTRLRHVPPGRAGRLWLLGRLRAGRLAVTLLDRKLRLLRGEQRRLRLWEERSAEQWRRCWRTADDWGLRAALLSGERDVRLCTPDGAADVTLTWTAVMGVRYPTEAACHLPTPSGADRSPATAALVEAGTAYRAAVVAAAEHAVARAAVRIVDEEVAATARRLRAVADRWVPRLESALGELARELDETEREETFRLRWASDVHYGGTVPP